MNKYELKISNKTRIFNFFRKVFTIPFLESLLVKVSSKSATDSFIGKIIPPSYLYRKNSMRTVIRNGFIFELNLNDMVDHYIYFGYEEPAFNSLFRIIKPGMIVFDIGSNIGQVSMHFANRTGDKGKVYCFEPDTINFNKLDKNTKLNNIKNIELFQLALGDENITAKLYNVYSINRGMCRILDNLNNEFEFSEIIIETLDLFCQNRNIDHVDLIKIDVEGFELNVLKGAETILKKFKPILFVELDDEYLKEHRFNAKKLLEFLFSHNYTVYHAETNQQLTLDMDFSNCHHDIIATSNI